ncbi:MAG: transcriptional regulator NrdR [Acidimicrobiales bacterium]
MRCPRCSALDDRVVDSRMADDGSSTRRRRQCLGCGHRFTTFERVEEAPLFVCKRSGGREPFIREKIVAGVKAAAKGRPVSDAQMNELASGVEDAVRLLGREASSAEIGAAVLERLRRLDEVAYVRFASVYKGFDDPADFEREIGLLAGRLDPPKADQRSLT